MQNIEQQIINSNLPHKSRLGLRAIGAFKMVYAIFVGAVGFGIFHILHTSIDDVVRHYLNMLHLGNKNQEIDAFLTWLSTIDRNQLIVIGTAVIGYSMLCLIQGIGLILYRRWAEYLTLVSTGFLIPFELYELGRKISIIKTGVLLVNVAIVVFIGYLLWRQHKIRLSLEKKEP